MAQLAAARRAARGENEGRVDAHKPGIFNVAPGARAASYGMHRSGVFSVLDAAEADRRSGNQELELGRRMEVAYLVDGKPAAYQHVNHNGTIYRLNNKGRLRELDAAVLARAKQRREQIDSFIATYLDEWGVSNESGAEILGCEEGSNTYQRLTMKYNEKQSPDLGAIAHWMYPPNTFIPTDLLDVECSAVALRYLRGEKRDKAISRVMFLLEAATSLPPIVNSGMSARAAAFRNEHLNEDPAAEPYVRPAGDAATT